MSLLPSSRPELEAEQQGDFRLLGFDEETSDVVLDALASETARGILRQLHVEPRTPSELAEIEDLSIQNVTYHLEKLEAADLIKVTETQYSEKGREMNIYGPADEPLVVFVGTDRRKLDIKSLLKRIVGASGLLAILSLLLQAVVTGEPPFLNAPTAGGGQDAVEPILPLATAFFLGGLVMLLISLVWFQWRSEHDRVLNRSRSSATMVGRDRGLSRRVTLATGGISAIIAVAWTMLYSSGIAVPSIGPLHPAIWVTLVLLSGATIQAYYNDGLVVSWVVVFGPLTAIGFGMFAVGPVQTMINQIPGIIGYPIIIGGTGALIIGSFGFLIGAAANRLIPLFARKLLKESKSI